MPFFPIFIYVFARPVPSDDSRLARRIEPKRAGRLTLRSHGDGLSPFVYWLEERARSLADPRSSRGHETVDRNASSRPAAATPRRGEEQS